MRFLIGQLEFQCKDRSFAYETASFEKKKMIVNCLINRVDVYRRYKLHIDFNFDYQQFLEGLDCIEGA